MGKFSTTGIDDFAERFKRIEQGLKKEALTNILNAGGEIVKKSWEEQITLKNHIRSHAMIDNLKITQPVVEGYTAYVEIYPHGTDKHRINNAQKAYILNAGRRENAKGKGAITGDNFVRDAERKAKRPAIDAMQKALDEYIDGKG